MSILFFTAVHCQCIHCFSFQGEGSSSEERLMQQVAGLQQLLPLREFELETERLRARGEHLRAQCDVLTLALDEARANAEKLTLLCGKYESNTTALWLALSHSDAALEAYDVLLALLESELAALVATCRAAGIPAVSHCPAVIVLAGDHDSPGLALARAGDIRQTAESVASLLLAKLDRSCDSGNQDGVKHHGEGRGSWSQGEESRLRNHIGRLKSERSRVRATAQPGLESIHADPAPPRGRNPPSVAEARKLDLETAVLMQELMAMREDRAELRARCHALERERATLELRLSGQEAQRQAQGTALSSLQQQLRDSESRLSGTAVGEEGEGRELTEALAREARLKERLQEMMVSLDTVSRSADIRHQQANEMLTEMKRANSSLAVMLDKCKKKYQARLRKLEHQSVVTIERHSTQVRALKQRISALESELAASNPPSSHGLGANETSL
ncbi:hypothetical protein B566_EDAN005854 [Ephemera danica]|nr:hypothetical protein B566_EDAN005854 [Ephemera danica]